MDRIRKFEPIFGEWYAESFIGAGSFGRVYKIYREELGNRFYSALKYISLPAESGEITQLRFDGMDDASISTYYTDLAKDISSEITLMNKLRGNSNIVSFEDSKVIPKPDGMGYDIFIRMELLESLTSRTTNTVTSPEETVKIGLDICNALVRCQKNNIIHRDIKPDNIFVSEDGDYKLGDFGVARKLEKAATFMSKKGTYNYMAPEVYKGERYGAACDIYSLGLVMYRMLNRGRLPFLPPAPAPILTSDREGALLRRMGGEALPAPCEADPELAAIVLKACEFRETDRYASAADMRKALQNYSLRRGDSPAPQPKEERDPYEATGGAYNSVPAPSVKPEPRTAYEATGGTFGSSAVPSPAPAVHESVKENSCDATSGVFGAAAAAAAPQQRANDYDATSGVFSSSIKNEKAPEPEEYSFDPDATQALSSTRNRRPEPKKAEPPVVKPIEPAAPVQPVQPVQPVKAEAGGKKKKTGLIIGIAAAAVAMTVGVLAIAGVFGGKKNTTADASAGSDSIEGESNGIITEPIIDPNVKVGDIVVLGSYEQDNDTSNGKEPIEWIVQHVEGDYIGLVSRYVLDARSFNDLHAFVDWRDSNISTWLNGDFMNNAFSEAERGMIFNARNQTNPNPTYGSGNEIIINNNYVRLMSLDGVNGGSGEETFNSDADRVCTPTEYAKAQGVNTDEASGSCAWWTRTNGKDRSYVVIVDTDGSISMEGCAVQTGGVGVRPYIVVSLSRANGTHVEKFTEAELYGRYDHTEKEPNDSDSTALLVKEGESYVGKIADCDDYDSYKIKPSSNGTWTIHWQDFDTVVLSGYDFGYYESGQWVHVDLGFQNEDGDPIKYISTIMLYSTKEYYLYLSYYESVGSEPIYYALRFETESTGTQSTETAAPTGYPEPTLEP